MTFSQEVQEECDLALVYRGEVDFQNLMGIDFIVPTIHFLLGEVPNGYYAMDGFEVEGSQFNQRIDSDYTSRHYCLEKELIIQEISDRNNAIMITIVGIKTEADGIPKIPMQFYKREKVIPIDIDNLSVSSTNEIVITLPQIKLN
ncbi:MAG: hypothetical protein KTR22_08695 [Flavobacteriaceae bacterium]|nr:hypothetical protein [Flavobacteriaceae bacterium]